MQLRSLYTSKFRNLTTQEVIFNDRVNVFVGQNGQGKTNLLEAVYFMLKGKSFRTSNVMHILKSDPQNGLGTHLRGETLRGAMRDHVQIEVCDKKKSVFLNAKKTSWTQFSYVFPVILFCPDSLASIKEGPELRRELLDDLIVTHSPHRKEMLIQYKQILKMRNKVLNDIAHEKIKRDKGIEIVDSMNHAFLRFSAEVVDLRLRALRDLIPLISETFAKISGTANVDISVEYVSSLPHERIGFDEIYDALSKRLEELRTFEYARGSSLIGPHKHDFRFLINAHDARFFASQGQQRALVLAFKIAQIVYHERTYKAHPVLLLDDVLSELDTEKRRYLIEFLKNSRSQTILTTTDFSFDDEFDSSGLSQFSVQDGLITKNI